MNTRQSALLTSLLMLCTPALAAPVQLDASQRQNQAVTLYNQNLALIENRYTLPILAPGTRVEITDISKQVQTESLRFEHPGDLLNQGYDQAVLSYEHLLHDTLGKPVTLARTNPATGEETRRTVTLRALDQPFALVETPQGIETIPLNGAWRFIFGPMHSGKAHAYFTSAGTREKSTVEMRYLSRGLSWSMQYQLVINPAEDTAQLHGLASIRNQTQHSYSATPLQLLAGEISVPHSQQPEYNRGALAMASDAAPTPKRQALQGQHLYTLAGPVQLPAQQLLQVPLFAPVTLKAKTDYRHEFRLYPRPDSQRYILKPQAHIKITNQSDQPLPAGQVQIMRRDQAQRLQLVGNASLPNLAAQQSSELNLGKAFDLTITRYQTRYSQVYQGALIDYRVEIDNAGTKAQQVSLAASFPNQWNIKSSSIKQQPTLGGAAQWQIQVPAGSSRTLDFQVEINKR